ncbi:MAG: agmatinase [Bacteroidetes bacterium]|nr:MAG: agmatinase [Bacteroidota bacterium]
MAQIRDFDPNGVGLKNGHFIGLPFDEASAQIVLFSVPWDVTVSFADGTATGPQNILECSSQLDLYDPDVPDAWKTGLFMVPPSAEWLARNEAYRARARAYIEFLENGGDVAASPAMQKELAALNEACAALRNYVFTETRKYLDAGKMVGVVGGEHSVPLGFLEALGARHDDWGILQIDAHMDLRAAYEGFTWSHASIFYNALKINSLSKLVQVGIRDYCDAEKAMADASGGRISVFYDQDIKEDMWSGRSFASICEEVVRQLPAKVYVSFDIDGLDPALCPHTGTPVPGGFSFEQALFLLKTLAKSGRQIIGFDLSETAGLGHDWDGNVGARILYKLSNWMAATNGLAG